MRPPIPLSFLVLCLAGAAAGDEAPKGFHAGRAEGWFWYEDPPQEAEAPSPGAQSNEPEFAVAPEDADASSPAPSGPTPLSSAWLREHLDRYRDAAVDDPTPAKVRAYLMLQRVAMDRASAFARATQAVTLGDPLLDANAERPIASFGAQAMDAQAHRARQALLAHLSHRIGLVFFYASTCPYCEQQAPLLEAIERTTGLEVMAVALDGRPMTSGAFHVDWVPDRGQAALLGVRTVPAIALMRPPGEIRLVGQGLMTRTDLERRILLVAKQAGWISEEAWEATLPVQRSTTEVSPAEIDPEILEDPDRLVAWLRGRMTGDGVP
ncbi:MAG: conjugal transfer protein TraF [Pseudomonadota bacterium]